MSSVQELEMLEKEKPEGFVPAIANTMRESEFWLVDISGLLHQSSVLFFPTVCFRHKTLGFDLF